MTAGADVDGGGTHHPLGRAAWRGRPEVVRVLVGSGATLVWPNGSALGAALHGALHCGHAEGGPTMGTVDEIDHGDYAEVVRILLDAGAQVPAGSADVLARLGIAGQTTAPSSESQSSSSSS